MVAVNYVGEELWSFYEAPWEKRVDLAKQLLDIAEQLTNNDFDFALYLLDVSFDNFAVGPRDGKVIVVDAENVLVADKRLIKQSEGDFSFSLVRFALFLRCSPRLSFRGAISIIQADLFSHQRATRQSILYQTVCWCRALTHTHVSLAPCILKAGF